MNVPLTPPEADHALKMLERPVSNPAKGPDVERIGRDLRGALEGARGSGVLKVGGWTGTLLRTALERHLSEVEGLTQDDRDARALSAAILTRLPDTGALTDMVARELAGNPLMLARMALRFGRRR